MSRLRAADIDYPGAHVIVLSKTVTVQYDVPHGLVFALAIAVS
jgi:hypothetical protein